MRLLMTLVVLSMTLWATDSSIGTWKRNIEKSKANPPNNNPITNNTMVREANGPDGVKVTNTGLRKDGAQVKWSYTAKYDGKEVAVVGDAPFDMLTLKQIDAHSYAQSARKKGGKYNTTGRVVISKDGKTLTLTTKGMNADGQPYSQTIVYDKQ